MAIKRMTADQKQSKLLSLIKYNEMYHIKELEKIAIKADIRSSAKEILEFLVAENLLKQEKIGISNIYWKKPENYKKIMKNLEIELNNLEILENTTNKQIERLKNLQKDQKNLELLKILNIKHKEAEDLKENLKKYASESEFLKLKKENNANIKEINTITDNIFEVINFLRLKGKETKEIYKAFGIQEDFDYF